MAGRRSPLAVGTAVAVRSAARWVRWPASASESPCSTGVAAFRGHVRDQRGRLHADRSGDRRAHRVVTGAHPLARPFSPTVCSAASPRFSTSPQKPRNCCRLPPPPHTSLVSALGYMVGTGRALNANGSALADTGAGGGDERDAGVRGDAVGAQLATGPIAWCSPAQHRLSVGHVTVNVWQTNVIECCSGPRHDTGRRAVGAGFRCAEHLLEVRGRDRRSLRAATGVAGQHGRLVLVLLGAARSDSPCSGLVSAAPC